MKRKSISKKLRFEVFKRDSFTCQYCGKSSPDVVLHIDHLNPVAKGGTSDILNLITACEGCNAGKSDRLLDDNTVLEKQKQQLAQLNERREQLKMMIKWRDELIAMEAEQIEKIETILLADTNYVFNDSCRHIIKKLLKEYGFTEVATSCDASRLQYLRFGSDGQCTRESVNKAFEYVGKICAVRKASLNKPYLPDLLKLKGLVKKVLWHYREDEIIKVLEMAYKDGASIEELREYINATGTWRGFKDLLHEVTGVYYG